MVCDFIKRAKEFMLPSPYTELPLDDPGHYDADIILKEVDSSRGDVQVGQDLYHDIEMFVDYAGQRDNTVIRTFQPALAGSYTLLEKMLSQPFSCVKTLETRQDVIKYLAGKSPTQLDQLKTLENDVMWVFAEKDETLQDLFDIIYFRWFFMKRLNNYPIALTTTIFYKIVLSPLFGIMTPIIYFLIPFLIVRFKFKINISFTDYLRFSMNHLMSDGMMSMTGKGYKWLNKLSMIMTLVFYFQGIFGSIDLAQTYYKISKHLTERMNKVIEFVAIGRQVLDDMWHENMRNFFPAMTEKSAFSFDFTPKKYSVFSHFGKQLYAFKTLKLDELKSFVRQVYVVDALHAVAKYTTANGNFAEYFTNDASPALNIEGIWHPCIDCKKAVKNNLMTDPEKRNVIITGPNAGGKSTFIKSLLINVVFSQTLGISVCSRLVLTPFNNIRSQINIPDDKGHASLFEAEMYRCKHNLDLIKEHPDHRMLLVMDEIFNSTNPVEGISGAFAIAHRLAVHPNTLVFFTTHYTYLSKLEKQSQFRNYRMNVIKNNDIIQYPYKLERGISKQYIALELLKLNGFDSDIIDHALILKEKFVPTRV
jgi:hypothetical protein